MTKRVAIYARYSSDLQKATSIEDQIAMAERHCEREGWTVVAHYIDREVSGRHTRRPGYQDLHSAAGRREFDVVVVESIDRMTRKVRDALGAYDLLSFQGIELVSIQEGQQDFMRVLFAGFGAQLFSEKISDHTKRGMQGAARRQQTHSKAFGYRKRDSEDGPNREIDPQQAGIVTRIYEEFASGRSATVIAAGLNADRIPSPNGGTWDGSTLRGNPAREEGILRNQLYIGVVSVCKTTHDHHPETGQRRIKPTPDEAVYQDVPELRIIPQPLWDDVQAELVRRSAANPKAARAAHRNKYLLSGLLHCACCGAPYVIASKTGYRCGESRKGACENKTPISRKRIETRVFSALRTLFQSEELQAAFDAALKVERKKLAGGSAQTDLKRLQAALKKAESGQENILKAIADGAPYDMFKAKADALADEITSLKHRINNMEARIAQQNAPLPDAKKVFAQALQKMEQLLSAPDYVDEASTYLKMLIARITLTPDPKAQHGMQAKLHMAEGVLVPAGTQVEDTAGDGGCIVEC